MVPSLNPPSPSLRASRGLFGAHRSKPAMSIIGAEDEDFENDLADSADDKCKAFDSIELLKTRPTHLLVFIQHLILQFDPAPLLCYLHADIVKNLNSRETKKQFPDFYNNFLDKSATLRVAMPFKLSSEFDRTRPELLADDTQRHFAEEVQKFQASEVAKQLEDFRQKRMMGMTLLEEHVTDVENHYPTDRVPKDMKEKSVAENLLEKMYDSQLTFVSDEEKCQAIFNAVAAYMKHLDVKNRAGDSKKSKRGFPWIKQKSTDPPKSKTIRGFHVPNWIGGSIEVKTKDPEVDKDIKGREAKGASGRGSLTEPQVPLIKKPESAPLVPSVEPPGPLGNNSSTINNTELAPNDGQPGNCLELPSPSDGPLTEMGAGVSVVEHSSPHDAHPEELDKDSVNLDAPAFNLEVPGPSPASSFPHLEEVDPRLQELELDPPSWRQLAFPEVLKNLSKKETKRQEVINELFATEHAHVRMLSVLQLVFAKPLERENLLTSIELESIFPNLEEIIEMHLSFYESLKKLRISDNFIVNRISTTLLNRFGGPEGEWFQRLTSRFCSHQTWALDQIKQRQKKDPSFNSFIQ
ncbi:hypothetical protein AMECASPLE_003596, partial [Ameca splendens]